MVKYYCRICNFRSRRRNRLEDHINNHNFTCTTEYNGRFCNQLFRNLVVNFIAKKNNLYVNYSSYDKIKKLGIELFIGEKKYNNSIILSANNLFDILSRNINFNLNANCDHFQTYKISNKIYDYLNSNYIKNKIKESNKFKNRYENNNDIFIHVRLGDVIDVNPGTNYYLKCIKMLEYDNIYLASDSLNHSIIKDIVKEYPSIKLIDYDEVETIQYGSTCKNVILSQGTFSAIIGYLSFYSKVFYPELKKTFCGDIFSIKDWNKIKNFL
jgi:hypothetical protein